VPTRIDPTEHYEILPIELGAVNGVRTRLHVIGLPGAPEQSPTRKQLLDRIDGIVFVADSRPECLEDNVASLRELRQSLASYGHAPDDLPFVVQYNKCDLVDPFAIERLHRELEIAGAARFEAAAPSGTGVLKTLTTISKQVVRVLGKRQEAGEPPPPVIDESTGAPVSHEPVAEPIAPATVIREEEPVIHAEPLPDSSSSLMEAAILAEGEDHDEMEATEVVASEAQSLLDQTWDALSKETKPAAGIHIGADLQIVSVGTAEVSGRRSVRVPLVLGNDGGETLTLALTLQLDPLLDDEA
jgi:signal recognition particle receptor subunit beta